MYLLIEQYFEGELSPEGKRELFEKIDTDEKWKEEFIAIQNLRGLTAWAPVATSCHKTSANVESSGNKSNKRIISPRVRHFIGYAAAILIAFTLARFAGEQKGLSGESVLSPEKSPVYQEISTPAGQRAFVRLPDSSTIWLNARTTLRYPVDFSEKERHVELDGEAFFVIKENPESPFIVSTENYNIKVTGTSFNVYAYKNRNEFSASLTEGSVQVFDLKDKTQCIRLKPNERAELVNGQLTKTDFHNMDFLLWKDGIYAFDDLPFYEIIKKLELYYDIAIIVNNNSIRNYKFSGKFRQRDGVERALRTLQKIHPFSFVKDDELNTIIIK
ncbi:MAG: FecR domain-containing protein [Tannerella sp.]|jgi:ferric-dicitrate binding protein FerR (iron transport regulator)|nr:FecR domain-containing protein [Tannerella sp.]